MRRLGTLPTERDALTFRDYLYLQKIETDVEGEDDGSFGIWVHDDAQLPAASQFLERFRSNPSATEFSRVSQEASRARSAEERADAKRRSTIVDRARVGYEKTFMGASWLPIILIGISVLVAIFSKLGSDHEALRYLCFAWPDPESATGMVSPATGQIWRAITPIFIHFGPLHLLFNAMWMKDLGTFIESRFGSWYLGVLVLVLAVASNTSEYLWSRHLLFGGLSGVNYGLFGFLWMRGKFDRNVNWEMHQSVVTTMLVWYVLCLTGVLGHIANAAHTVGLLLGGAWGFASSGRIRLSR
jgi:GlpG protein